MERRYFCTYFDINYFPHAMSLYSSLISHCPNAHLFMVCMDDESFSLIASLSLEQVTVLNIKDVERSIPKLAGAKNNRSRVEYFYTCSSAICFFLLKSNKEITELTYLDSDLYFFSSVEPIFQELKDKSIGIIAHKFAFISKANIKYGKYNVGWITFKRDHEGLRCVTDWKDNSIEWCYQRVEKTRYADQKYLDYWPVKYKGVHIIKNKGANVAIWNIGNYRITKNINGDLMVDNTPLIFYHFANFKQLGPRVFKTDLSKVLVRLSNVLRYDIYEIYALSLLKFQRYGTVIRAKEDIHISGPITHLRNFVEHVRNFLFPDIIKL